MAATGQQQAASSEAPGPQPWGIGSAMNGLEALMWRAESDPQMRSPVVAIELLDRPPDWERLYNAHDWASRLVPRFRSRVVEPGMGIGAPRWVVDERFDLAYHVRRQRLPEPGSWAQLLEAAQLIATTPFDRKRPPWEAYVLEGLEDGRAVFVLKVHHSMSDGLGFVQLLSGLHSRRREPTRGRSEPAAPEAVPLDTGKALVEQLAGDARGLAGAMGRAVASLGALRRPEKALRDAAGFGSSMRRVLDGPPVKGSPLLARRSLSWRFVTLAMPFADFRAAAKAHECTLNDAFLAALLGGFRRYHDELGAPIEALAAAIPISVRRDDDEAGGNRFVGARLALPVGEHDPLVRMQAVRELIRSARGEPAMEALGMVAPLIARLPGPVIGQVAGSMTSSNDLQASNVPGIREDVYIAGAKIERLFPFAPLPGCAAMICLVTHGDTCCVGANLDAAAFTEVDRFARCLHDGFAEVLELGPAGAGNLTET